MNNEKEIRVKKRLSEIKGICVHNTYGNTDELWDAIELLTDIIEEQHAKKSAEPIKYCPDCGNTHLHGACGDEWNDKTYKTSPSSEPIITKEGKGPGDISKQAVCEHSNTNKNLTTGVETCNKCGDVIPSDNTKEVEELGEYLFKIDYKFQSPRQISEYLISKGYSKRPTCLKLPDPMEILDEESKPWARNEQRKGWNQCLEEFKRLNQDQE